VRTGQLYSQSLRQGRDLHHSRHEAEDVHFPVQNTLKRQYRHSRSTYTANHARNMDEHTTLDCLSFKDDTFVCRMIPLLSRFAVTLRFAFWLNSRGIIRRTRELPLKERSSIMRDFPKQNNVSEKYHFYVQALFFPKQKLFRNKSLLRNTSTPKTFLSNSFSETR
jgi:hypothetical protein